MQLFNYISFKMETMKRYLSQRPNTSDCLSPNHSKHYNYTNTFITRCKTTEPSSFTGNPRKLMSMHGRKAMNMQIVSGLRQRSSSRRQTRLTREDYEAIRSARSADPAVTYRKRLEQIRKKPEEIDKAVIRKRKQDLRQRLKNLLTLVRTIVRCMRSIVHMSCTQTVRTAVELQWHTLNTSTEARKLAFNPAVYAKSRVHAKLPRWARWVLEKAPEARSDLECRRLHALLRGLRSFDKFTERIQLAMCRSFTYLRVSEQRVILRKGHVGQNFYFLYSGSVFVNVDDVNQQGENFVKTEAVLTKGDSFGELALLNDITRTATVSCREECELLGVDKQVFSQVCPRIFDLELEEKTNFVSNLPLFYSKYWPEDILKNLCFDSQIQEYKTNKVVVADSTGEDWMYICMEGRCRIIKCLDLEEDNDDPQQGALLKEDELLTAEFLDSMGGKKVVSSSGGANLYRKSSRISRHASNVADHGMKSKRHLLQSLGLEYYTNQKQQKDVLAKSTEQKNADDLRQRAQQGVITLTTLLRNKMSESPDTVCLSIGVLNQGDVFDLPEILQPSNLHTRSCLALISSGARLLRIRKDKFWACLRHDAREHAKHIAVKQQYPSNSILLASYKHEAKWNKYKNKILKEVLEPCTDQSRRRDVTERVLAMSQLHTPRDLSRDHRLMSTLRHQEDILGVLEKAQEGGFALDEPALLVDHEDFESRLLREVDQKMSRNLRISHHGNVKRRASIQL